MRDFAVILAAAGAGRRFGGRKQFLRLLDRPVIHYSLDAFAEVRSIGQIVVVFAPEDLDQGTELVTAWRSSVPPELRLDGLALKSVEGGARRQDSVRRGIDAVDASTRYALVHDAARPLIRPADVERLVAATRLHGAAVLGTPAWDSVKRVRGGEIVDEIPRDEVWTVQTPQAAEVVLLRKAYDSTAVEMTDEASALRALGVRVALVEGSRENLKITRPGDEAAAEAFLRARRAQGASP